MKKRVRGRSRRVRRSVAPRRVKRTVRASSNSGMRLSPYAFGHSFGILSVIALLFYAFMSWFAGYDSSFILRQYPLGFSFNDWTILIGIVQTYVMSYIGGWIFVKMYNKVLRS